MSRRRRIIRAGTLIVAAFLLCHGARTAAAQSDAGAFVGRQLEAALRVLQLRGLRLVFSSEVVRPDMRVRSEPRATSPREQLSELLAPHGLAAENGPGGIIQVVRQKRRAPPPAREHAAPARARTAGAAGKRATSADTYKEELTVTTSPDGPGDVNLGTARRLESDALRAYGGYIADDPLRVVQALPGVASGDDFRSEYSVRGSPYRHAGLVVDGVAVPWLQHAAPARGDTGTMSMVPAGMVQDATLLVGAYPRRESGQLGPQLNLTLREGSRTGQQFHVGVSSTTTTLTAEGPVGRSARGSWLVGARRSHVEWPVGRDDHHATVFGYSDIQSKLVYDVRPGQQVSFSLVAGLSDVERENASPFALADGVNRAAMAAVTWRSVIGSKTLITHRVSVLAHDFRSVDQAARPVSRGTDDADGYGADVSRALFGGVVEAGGVMRRARGSREGLTTGAWDPDAAMALAMRGDAASWLERSGYASFRRAAGLGVTLSAGLRLADSTLVEGRAVDRWLQAEWVVGPRWLVHGSTGIVHQFPSLDQVDRRLGDAPVRPERATYADLGVGQRISTSVRWDATVFARWERDALRAPDVHPRLIDGVLTDARTAGFENALSGSSRGVELRIERQSDRGVSGWIGYSYGTARYVDTARLETFPADFDQRHALNIAATAPLPWGARGGLTFRSGTNFPIPGYLVVRGDRLFVGDARNQVRLPIYARLDLRAERAFARRSRRFTLFAEALNVLNRTHLGLADGAVIRSTGEAVGFTERLFPRLMTAGVRVDF